MKSTILTLWLIGLSAALGGCNGCSPLDPAVPGTTGNPGSNTGTDGIHFVQGATGATVPEFGVPLTVEVISRSTIDADVLLQYFVNDVEVHRSELRVPAGQTMTAVGPDLTTRVTVTGRYVDGGALPPAIWLAGQDFNGNETKQYIIADPADACPDDPAKTQPGICGCGVPDTDTDGDGTPDCNATIHAQTGNPDFDLDGDVDQADFGHLQACLGDSNMVPEPACQNCRLNADAGVDQGDVTAFVACFAGPNVVPALGCLP